MRGIISSGLIALAMLLSSNPANAQTIATYNPATGTVSYSNPPYTTSYYVDPMSGAAVSYQTPVVAFQPGPRVYGPGAYYTYSPSYYSPTYTQYSYSYPGYTYPGYTTYYYPGYTSYYRTWRYWR